MKQATTPTTDKKYEAIIFDMDGTLFDTSAIMPLIRQLRQVKRKSAEYYEIWKKLTRPPMCSKSTMEWGMC